MIILTTLNLIAVLLSIGFVLISLLFEEKRWGDSFSLKLYRLEMFSIFVMNIFIIIHDSHLTVVLQ